MVFILEPDIYRLSARSHLPSAEKFKAWIFEDAIPTIRKTGSYGKDPVAMLEDPVHLRGLLEHYTDKVIEMTPKAQFADAVTASETSIAVGGLAKLMRQNGAGFPGRMA
jgi:anti-repressor protein